MKFPVIELVDRYAISVVKHKRTNGANQEELDFYTEQIKQINLELNHPLLLQLIEHHDYVWSLEDDFKKFRIDNQSIETIGRQAIKVRDSGSERVKLKNLLAELLNDPVREIKRDHSSDQ